MTMSGITCPHGHDGWTDTVVDEDDMTACCGAFTTWTGDAVLVCRCCWAEVTGGADTGFVGTVVVIENGGLR